MSLTVETALQHIEDASPAFHKIRVDAGVAIRALERSARWLVAEIMRERPEALVTTVVSTAITTAHLSGTGYDFAAGVMPYHVEDVEAREVSGQWRPVDRVGWDARYLPFRHPSVSIRGSVLYPLGMATQSPSRTISTDSALSSDEYTNCTLNAGAGMSKNR